MSVTPGGATIAGWVPGHVGGACLPATVCVCELSVVLLTTMCCEYTRIDHIMILPQEPQHTLLLNVNHIQREHKD